eukprot:Nk52_evm1s2515 gene=Nk52_evmTU1s2515
MQQYNFRFIIGIFISVTLAFVTDTATAAITDDTGKLVAIVVPCAIVGVMLFAMICFLCCCKRKEKREYEKFMKEQNADLEIKGAEREERSRQRKEEYQSKAEGLRSKYGIDNGDKKKKKGKK